MITFLSRNEGNPLFFFTHSFSVLLLGNPDFMNPTSKSPVAMLDNPFVRGRVPGAMTPHPSVRYEG